MNETEYVRLADEIFSQIESALDDCGADVDYEILPGGILELEFDNGSKIVINRQSATQEIWVAAKSGGFHYRWADSQWCDTRSGEELLRALSRLVSEQAGEPVTLG
jgi:CyaY protein